MEIFKKHKKYFFTFFIFCACLFMVPHVYSYWDFETINPIELYEMDKFYWRGLDPYMSYNAWIKVQDQKHLECIKMKNCEELQDKRHQEWVHYLQETPIWHMSDAAKKENN